jgi:nucleoside-diphosphate-sugar epimerase
MKILITGAGGFVGKRLCHDLTAKGHEIVAVVRTRVPTIDRHYFSSKSVRLLELDLSSLDLSLLPHDVEVIYSLAQSSYFRDFPEKADEVFTVNIAANFQLLQWARSTGVRKFIQVSSGGIYGGKLGKAFQEDDLIAVNSPLGFYQGSKLCSEIIFQNYRSFFETAVILRPFFIYGPGQRRDMFISRLIEGVRKGFPLKLQGKKGVRVNPIFVNDAVKAFSNAMELNGFHIINVAGPDALHLRQIGEIIGKAVGRNPVFEIKDGDPVDYVADTEQAVKKLRQPMTPFVDGITLTVGAKEEAD